MQTAMSLAALAATALAAWPAAAQNEDSFTKVPEGAAFTHAPVAAAAPCEALAGASLDGVSWIDAARTEAGGDVFCRVQGVIRPEIQFEVALPAHWNRRLYMFGNGGYAGEDLAAPERLALRDAALARGFMTVQQNTGHDRATEPLGSFADGDLSALIDYAFRAVHETVVTAKALAEVHYADRPSYSYWDGCSTGGRQGLMSAQRYPADFDGIVAGAPVLDLTGTQLWGIHNAQALAEAPIAPEQLPTLADAVMAQCDAIDGLEDGLITDPRQCDFDPAADLSRCHGEAGAGCFTTAQIGALEEISAGVHVDGEQVFPGVPWGVEGMAGGRSGWNLWMVSEQGPSRQLAYGETFLQNMALLPARGSDVDWREFDIQARYDEVDMVRDIVDASDPDLGDFARRGGKMLTYFGWADPALNPLMGVRYYERVMEAMGRKAARDSYRLFMAPGMSHCDEGYGPDQFDAMTPLIRWVETGAAPRRIVAKQVEDGEVVRTRPLCPYPQRAVYEGSGDPAAASSFTCEAPRS